MKRFNFKVPIYDVIVEFRFTDWEDLDDSDLLDPVEGNLGAYTGQKKDGSCVVILPYDYSMRLAIHEIVHAASFVLSVCGVRYNNEHHEQLAYLVDYIYWQFYLMVNEGMPESLEEKIQNLELELSLLKEGRKMSNIDQCQKDQLKKLRRSKNYREASAFTIIYDLLKSGIDKEEINYLIDEIEKDEK